MSLKKKGFLAIYLYIGCGIFILGVINRSIDYFTNPDLKILTLKSILIILCLIVTIAAYCYCGIWIKLKRKRDNRIFTDEFKTEYGEIIDKYNKLTDRLKNEVINSFIATPCPICNEVEIVLLDYDKESRSITVDCKSCGKIFSLKPIKPHTSNKAEELFNTIYNEKEKINSNIQNKYGKSIYTLNNYGILIKLVSGNNANRQF